jgi:hypothetical protein
MGNIAVQTSPNRMLFDFYLSLLAIPQDSPFRIKKQSLYSEVLYAVASELDADAETVQNIFERMAAEDA